MLFNSCTTQLVANQKWKFDKVDHLTMFEDFIIQNFVKLKKIKKSFAEKLSA